jgi:hypothetical protein
MSAAATAAGYLYASGRLRGRATREQDQSQQQQPEKREEKPVKPRREARIAVYEPEAQQKPAAPRKTPRIEYRTRRWRPDE